MARLRDFHGLHYGEAIVVCGLGASIKSFADPQRFRTIGVNDIGRALTPDYLFVMDAPKSFPPERFRYIQESSARYVFTDHDLGLRRDHVVTFPIRSSPVPRFDDPDALYLIGRPPTSPFLALCLAAHMGAKAIGIVGVDFTNGHFFADDGPHKLSGGLRGIDRRFYALSSALLDRGVKVFNLSAESRLSAFPRLTPDEFFDVQRSGRTRAWSRPARRVCLESSAAVNSNVTAIAKLINARTTVSCRVIAPRSPDIAAGGAVDIEQHVRTSAHARISCDAVKLPTVMPDDPRFLRTWHEELRPLLFAQASDVHPDRTPRAASVAAIVSQEHATGDEMAETVRSLWPDLQKHDHLIVLGRAGESERIPRWLRHSRRIRYQEQQRGESFIALRNRAAALTTADILVFTDANIQADAHWVDTLLEGFEDERAAAVGPGIIDMYERRSKGFGMMWTDAELNTTWLPISGVQPYAVPLLPGAFLAVRRTAFQRVGGFDGGMIGSGGDDVELCFNLWTCGFECRVAPKLEVSWMNPYAWGALRPSQYWRALLHNLLRLAAVHFSPARLHAMVTRLSGDPAFPDACARMLTSEASRRRAWIDRRRMHSDAWFFEKFAIA